MTAPSEGMLPFLAARLGGEDVADLRRVWRSYLPKGKAVRDACGLMHYGTGAMGEAVLMLPEGAGPHPAVVLMHDHGGRFDIGWRKMVTGAGSDAALYEGRHLADWLVAQGYAVFCADALGWGSRFAGGYDQQQALAAQAMQAGWSLAGIVAAEDLQAFDWLSRQPEIDATRIGVMGFSFGGFRAWQLAALEPRVRVCTAVGWMGRRADLLHDGGTLVRGQSAFYTLHPFLRADYPEMAALAADRPLFMRVGDSDKHFPKADFGPLGALGADVGTFAGAHTFPRDIQDMAAHFLGRHLR